ncbi:5-formyltetrahydrofolate cyclo-ligase family protein [compost metagenome]
MTYVPFRSELDLSGLMEWGWRTGRAIIVPRCKADDFSMSLYYLRSWDELAPGAYGIREPDPEAAVPVERGLVPEVVFVPGLAFDRRGGRLGYGGGYYDRFAASLRMQDGTAPQMLWIGAAFEKQLIADVPLELHDLKMNGIVTEVAVYIDEE